MDLKVNQQVRVKDGTDTFPGYIYGTIMAFSQDGETVFLREVKYDLNRKTPRIINHQVKRKDIV